MLASACTPTPGTVDVAGDSVSAQAFGYTSARPGVTAVADQEMVRYGWGCHDVEAILRRHVNAARPETLIWALGPNDADPASGGWELSDVACWHDAFGALDPATCLVIVMPGYGAGFPPAWAAEVDEIAGYLPLMIDGRPGTVVEDGWQAIVDEHPEYLDGGGIHKGSTEAAEARLQLYADGADQCGSVA